MGEVRGDSIYPKRDHTHSVVYDDWRRSELSSIQPCVIKFVVTGEGQSYTRYNLVIKFMMTGEGQSYTRYNLV